MQLTNKQLREFFDYCLSFYGSGGVYDMGATMSQVATATSLSFIDPPHEFQGDSLDRERVRNFLESRFGLSELKGVGCSKQ